MGLAEALRNLRDAASEVCRSENGPPRLPMRDRDREAGYSLVELLIGLAVASVLSGAIAMLAFHVQVNAVNLFLLMDRDRNLRPAPLLLARWLLPAGNALTQADGSPLEWDGVSLHMKADIHGAHGFPDGRLEDSYESLSLRRSGDNLQIRSGSGSFQPVLRHVRGFEARLEDPALLQLFLEVGTERPPTRWRVAPSRELRLDFHLPNLEEGK